METCPDRISAHPGAYLLGILVPWVAFCALYIAAMLIEPATVCSPPEAMCCYICAVIMWLTVIPFVGYIIVVLIFAPGIFLVAFIARRVRRWRPVYWLFGWTAAGMLSVIPVATFGIIYDRQIIAININNGILTRLAYDYGLSAIGLGFFGLMCGICYWAILVKTKWIT
jgi:hypothetical protein